MHYVTKHYGRPECLEARDGRSNQFSLLVLVILSLGHFLKMSYSCHLTLPGVTGLQVYTNTGES